MKYMNMFVILAFLAGQVQFVCVSYFCTVEQKAVQRPTMSVSSSNISDSDMCDECQGIVPPQNGRLLLKSNCLKVVSIEKGTVDSFAEWAKFQNHAIASLTFIQAIDYPLQIGYKNSVMLLAAESPPSDLPTLNSNLRI